MAFSGGNSAEAVIFRYPVRLDTFNQPVAGTGVDVVVEECVFAPGHGDETTFQANQALIDGQVYAQPDAPAITAQDQIVIRGEVFDVAEPPKVWLNEAVVIPVRRVTG